MHPKTPRKFPLLARGHESGDLAAGLVRNESRASAPRGNFPDPERPAERACYGRIRWYQLVLVLSLIWTGGAAADEPTGGFRHLGLQLYSLRAQIKEDVGGALDHARAWGITEVETAGTAGLPAEQFLAMLQARVLKPVSAHLGFDRLEKDLAGAVLEARTLGVGYAICPSLPHQDKFDDAAALKAAAKLNEWGAAFQAAGIQFGYHTHGFEFFPSAQGGDDKVFDVLVRATDPRLVCLEMDVLWVYRAGVDPVALLEKYPGRWAMLHVKDLRRGAARGPEVGSSALATDRVSVGTGQIDWPAILRTAEKAGVRYYFIEDETTAPLENIPASLAWLQQLKK